MKTMISRIIPVAAMLLATAGAIGTHAMERQARSSALHDGFIRGNQLGTVCTLSNMCSDQEGEICTVGSTQLWGKDGAGRCVVERYKIEP